MLRFTKLLARVILTSLHPSNVTNWPVRLPKQRMHGWPRQFRCWWVKVLVAVEQNDKSFPRQPPHSGYPACRGDAVDLVSLSQRGRNVIAKRHLKDRVREQNKTEQNRTEQKWVCELQACRRFWPEGEKVLVIEGWTNTCWKEKEKKKRKVLFFCSPCKKKKNGLCVSFAVVHSCNLGEAFLGALLPPSPASHLPWSLSAGQGLSFWFRRLRRRSRRRRRWEEMRVWSEGSGRFWFTHQREAQKIAQYCSLSVLYFYSTTIQIHSHNKTHLHYPSYASSSYFFLAIQHRLTI